MQSLEIALLIIIMKMSVPVAWILMKSYSQ